MMQVISFGIGLLQPFWRRGYNAYFLPNCLKRRMFIPSRPGKLLIGMNDFLKIMIPSQILKPMEDYFV